MQSWGLDYDGMEIIIRILFHAFIMLWGGLAAVIVFTCNLLIITATNLEEVPDGGVPFDIA